VGDPGDHLPEGPQLLRTHQLVLRPLQVPIRALQLGEEARVLDGHRRLGGEESQHFQILAGKGPAGVGAADAEDPHQAIPVHQRLRHDRGDSRTLHE
jgi:hypothetical protein